MKFDRDIFDIDEYVDFLKFFIKTVLYVVPVLIIILLMFVFLIKLII